MDLFLGHTGVSTSRPCSGTKYCEIWKRNENARLQNHDPILFALDLNNSCGLSVVLFLHSEASDFTPESSSKLCMVDPSGGTQRVSLDQR